MGRAAWVSPESFPTLGADEVHVWQSRLSEQAARLAALRPLLNAQERQRASRFRADRDRDDYTVARGLLRMLIGRYENVDPRDVAFEYAEQGKPALARVRSGLEFNVSHSRDLALFAFARARRVGVDVEALKRGVDHEDIARRFFTPAESSALRSLPPARRPRAFFDFWVRKEAALKAWGTGFSLALDRFEVLPAGRATHRLECPHEIADLPRDWTIRPLHPASGYRAALVVEGGACALRRLRCALAAVEAG